MIRILKSLGVGIFATLAMSVAVAPAASASPFFHSEFAGVFLTGAQAGATPNVITTDLGEVKCSAAKFSGSQGAMTTTTMTLKMSYEGCKIGANNVTVTPNGCAYTFHLEEQAEPIEARMGIECPFAGGKIEIDAPNCTITIPEQGPKKEVTFTNEGAGTTRAVVADLNVSGIDYQEDGAGCVGVGTTQNGTYTGQITVRAEDTEENHVGIWVE